MSEKEEVLENVISGLRKMAMAKEEQSRILSNFAVKLEHGQISFKEFVEAVHDHDFPLAEELPNPAEIPEDVSK